MTHQLNQDLFGLKNRWLKEHGYHSEEKITITDAFEKWWEKQGFSQNELFLTNEYTDYEKKLINYYYDNLVKNDGNIDQTRKRLNDFISNNYSEKESELIHRLFDDNNVLEELDNYYQYQNSSVEMPQVSSEINSATQSTVQNASVETKPSQYNHLSKDKYDNLFNKNNEKVIQVLRDKHNYNVGSIRYSTIGAVIEMDKGIPSSVMSDLALGGSNAEAIHLYQLNDTLLIHAHGNPNGTLKYHGQELKLSDLMDFLESNNRIDDSITDVFTISCFGGNQEEFTSKKGRKVRSSHNSSKPIVGAPKTQYGQDKDLLLLSVDDEGQFSDDFLELIEKQQGKVKYLNVDIKENEIVDSHLLDGLDDYLKNKSFSQENIEQITSGTQDTIHVIEEPVQETTEKVTKETTKQAGYNFKETLEQSAKEVVEESAKEGSKAAIKSLPKKSLGGGGKLAIGLAIGGLILGGTLASSNNSSKKKSKKEKHKPHHLSRSTNSEEIDNGYAQQMAADISSYRYGKHMTGFVNF